MNRSLILLLLSALSAICYGQNTLTLEKCRLLALENSNELLIASGKLSIAQQERKSAFTKNLPNISATGSYLYNSRDISLISESMMLPIGTVDANGHFSFRPEQVKNQWTVVNGVPTPLDANGQPFNPATNPDKILWKDYTTIPKEALTFDTKNVFAAAVMLTQPVYMGGKIRAYNQITKYAEQIAQNQKDTKTTEIILRTDELYWQSVSLEHKQKLAKSYFELLEKLYKDVITMKKAGLATRSDELSVQVKLNEAQMTLTQVQDGLALSKMALAQICGLPMDGGFNLEDGEILSDQKPTNIQVNINQAIDSRKEIQSLTLATDIYKKKENIARSEFLPTLALTGAYSVSSPNVFNGFSTSPKGMFSAGVMLKVPIFHFGDRSAKMKIAKTESQIAQIELKEAREKVELQINQSIFSLQTAYKKVTMTASNLEKAQENLRYATLGYQQGVALVTNVFEAQTAWLLANSQNIDSHIELRMAQMYLKRAIGEGL